MNTKRWALIPEERDKICLHGDPVVGITWGSYTGSMPCTGPYRCTMCGTELIPLTNIPKYPIEVRLR